MNETLHGVLASDSVHPSTHMSRLPSVRQSVSLSVLFRRSHKDKLDKICNGPEPLVPQHPVHHSGQGVEEPCAEGRVPIPMLSVLVLLSRAFHFKSGGGGKKGT